MAETSLSREYGCCSIPEQSIEIEYGLNILSEIDRTVVEGFKRLLRGGVEVGGVLFGHMNGRKVTILDVRHLSCEHALGPGFVLSKTDHLALAELLESAKADSALRGLTPVGWYHSCTRSHIHLSSHDLELFERYFPEPSQITLILRPDHCQPTKAGFFFREEDGRIRSETVYREFNLPEVEVSRPVRTDRQMLAERVVRSTAPRPDPPASRQEVQPQPLVNTTGLHQKLAQLAMLAILTVGIGAWVTFQRRAEPHGNRTPAPVEERLDSITLDDNGGHLRIGWNRRAEPILRNRTGLLEITEDGRVSLVVLDANQLRKGNVFYDRTSHTVAVTLKVNGVEASAIYVGRPPNRISQNSAPETAAQAPAPVTPPVAPFQGTSREERADRVSPQENSRAMPEVRRVFRPSRVSHGPETPVMSLPMPPSEWNSPPALTSAPLIGRLTEVPPLKLPSSSQPKLVRTGGFVWTGTLSKSSMLSIEGNRVSTGTLTGAIPDYPVKVTVYPAELTAAGLKVYSSDNKYPAGYSEPPSAHNGWNKTSYVQDWRVAGSVKVVEAPNPKNNWKRLVVRDNGAKLSILIIKWEIL